jgi:hypothetical protein
MCAFLRLDFGSLYLKKFPMLGLPAMVPDDTYIEQQMNYFHNRMNNGVGSHSFPYELDAIVVNPLFFIRK